MDRAIEEFRKYTENYIEISDNCTLKIDHTFRVMKLCEKIAIGLGLNDEDIYIAKMCGLLHDIARFEQWKRYQSFSDLEGCDHGDLGVEILTENNFIRKFIYDDKYDSIIFDSIRFHNKYKIADELGDRERFFTKIVRDADKIDILYLFTVGHVDISPYDHYFNKEIFNSLMNHEIINKKNIKNAADKLSVSLGFIYDINFDVSLKILKENNYINKEIDIFINKSNSDKFKTQLESIRKNINNYIEERLEKS